MRIAVLGGSFDPPHIGHKILAEKIVSLLNFDKVLLIPCFKHDFGKKLSPVHYRLEMTRLLEEKNIEVSDIEIKRGSVSYSIDTLIELKNQYPNDNFYWVIGSDQLEKFETWGGWEKIISDFGLIVAKRGNKRNLAEKIKKNLHLSKLLEKILIIETDIPDISSTEIRNRVKNNQPINTFVPKGIEEYIFNNKLYK